MAIPPPGPKGEQLGRLNYEDCRADIFGFLKRLVAQYGDIVAFDLGRSPYIFINAAAPVHELFFRHDACLRKPEFIKDSNRGHWGDGLTTLEAAAWQSRRRMLRPCFRPGTVARSSSGVAQCIDDMVASWAAGRRINLLHELRILTARIAVRTVLGADLEGYGSGARAFIPFDEAYGEGYAGVHGGDLTAPLAVIRPRAPRRMDTVVRIIDERIAAGEHAGDMLSDLIQARLPDGTRLSRDEIVGEIVQMLYAGHHTIPATLAAFWQDLRAADLSARIATEAEGMCARGVPDPATIAESYCVAALKESMRLHPAAPVLYREVETEFELEGFAFLRGVAVWVSPQLLHTDPRNFPEPERFLPERFLGGPFAVTARSPYFPFGAGRRMCIANHLAVHQMALITLLTLRRWGSVPTQDGPLEVRPKVEA